MVGVTGVAELHGRFPLPVSTTGQMLSLSLSHLPHRCICNIDCSGHNENPVCATDGNSYNNPCLVREASCMKQEQIDVKHLGRCPGEKTRRSHTQTQRPISFQPSFVGKWCKLCSYWIHGDSSPTVQSVCVCPSQLIKTKVGRKTTAVLLKFSVRNCFIQIFRFYRHSRNISRSPRDTAPLSFAYDI